MAAETTILDYPGKVNDLEIALWASKNVQNITGSTIKTFQLKNQYKLSCKSKSNKFPFVVVVVVVAAHYLNISCIEYFLSAFPSSFIKISKNYENGLNLSIIHFWLRKHMFQLCRYIHMFLS